jgi:hypothetical protein
MAPVLFVRFSPKPGQAARVQALLQGMVAPTPEVQMLDAIDAKPY